MNLIVHSAPLGQLRCFVVPGVNKRTKAIDGALDGSRDTYNT